MKLSPFAQAYRQNSVQTASPGQLILMLFDGALHFMNRALLGFTHEDVIPRNEAVHTNLLKTQAIIDELQACLRHEVGGEFAGTMSALYDYMRVQLREANRYKVAAPVHIVMDLLGDIRAPWAAMLTQAATQDSRPIGMVATAA